jgi:hypothetical protein
VSYKITQKLNNSNMQTFLLACVNYHQLSKLLLCSLFLTPELIRLSGQKFIFYNLIKRDDLNYIVNYNHKLSESIRIY